MWAYFSVCTYCQIQLSLQIALIISPHFDGNNLKKEKHYDFLLTDRKEGCVALKVKLEQEQGEKKKKIKLPVYQRQQGTRSKLSQIYG